MICSHSTDCDKSWSKIAPISLMSVMMIHDTTYFPNFRFRHTTCSYNNVSPAFWPPPPDVPNIAAHSIHLRQSLHLPSPTVPAIQSKWEEGAGVKRGKPETPKNTREGKRCYNVWHSPVQVGGGVLLPVPRDGSMRGVATALPKYKRPN